AEAHGAQHGAEDLLPGDAHGARDVTEQRGLDVVALGKVPRALATHDHAGAFLLPKADVRAHTRRVLGMDQRTDLGALVERVSHADAGYPRRQRLDEAVVDALFDQHARVRRAAL